MAKRGRDFSMEDSNSDTETDREEPAEKIARKYGGAAKYGDGGKQKVFLMAPFTQMIFSNQGGGFGGQTNQSSGFTGWQPQEQQQQQQQLQEGGDESETRFLGVFGGGGVPAKPTGDVVDTEAIYRMSRAPRGIAIIINNKNFLRSSGMDKRNGTDVDRDALEKLFKSLMFKVRIYNDVTTDGIRRIGHEMAMLTDHSDYDAFIFSILTHGEEGLLYGTDGTISIRDLTSEFKVATTLAGKPKMFFFQACQGHEYMDGMDMADGPQANSSKVSVPAEADFLYAYSTVPGYYSWRNSVNGSWFIQSLTKVFEENAERMDILRMLTRVNAMVSTFKSHTGEYYSNSKRQVSSVVSMLRKELFFFPEKVTEQN